MTRRFQRPFLEASVELTDERERHIALKHASVLADDARLLEATLQEPDTVLRSENDEEARLFLRWYDEVDRGKYAVVVVISHVSLVARHWIITAYLANRVAGGTLEWQRS